MTHHVVKPIICPNCGATLTQNRFVLVCEFCGTVVNSESHSIVPQDTPLGNETEQHFAYLHENIERIEQSPFLSKIKTVQSGYEITSLSFYGCDKYCRRVTYPSLFLRYTNDGDNEMLLIGIMGNRPANRMILQLNEDIVSLPLQSQDCNTSWFRLSIEQLLQICTARHIDLDTDLETDQSIQYYELSTFASRFYNVVFNRMKFIYSVNVRLITDS